MSEEHQRLLLLQRKVACYKRMDARNMSLDDYRPPPNMCDTVWDEIICWDAVPSGTLAVRTCPDYVDGFNLNENATRYCTENGTWYVPPHGNTSWTNFTACLKPTVDLTFHKEVYARLRMLYSIGYSLSLAALIIAVFIMLFSRRLHCKSNTLHINLFIAFILRAAISFLRDSLLKGVALEGDIQRKLPYEQVELREGSLWQCKLLFVVFNYSITATFMWIFVEGLYLHLLVYKALFAERTGVRIYVILGWAMPALLLIPWVVLKTLYEDTLCWNIQENVHIYWLLIAPNVSIVVINFLSFVDVSRKLCIKARKRVSGVGKTKYRKLAKFILVLVPLFGVTYIIFLFAFPTKSFTDPTFNITHIYIEMIYSSFQGVVLAVLFCFLNEEVNGELRKMWKRHRSRRTDAAALRKSFANSGRNWSKSSPTASERRKRFSSKQCSSSSSRDCDHGDSLRKKALLTRAWNVLSGSHDAMCDGKEALPLTSNGNAVKDISMSDNHALTRNGDICQALIDNSNAH